MTNDSAALTARLRPVMQATSIDMENNAMENEAASSTAVSENKSNPTDDVECIASASRWEHVPVRLDEKERVLLRLLRGALDTSEYTDKVDIVSYYKKDGIIREEIEDMLSIMSGLMVASNFKAGEDLVVGKAFEDNESFFRDTFEVGRRYKCMNPDKLRTTYGKMMHMLQDASTSRMQHMTKLNLNKPMKTVRSVLESTGGLAILKDKRLAIATRAVSTDGGKKSRIDVEREVQEKRRVTTDLCNEYRSTKLSEKTIRLCVESISDARSYLMQITRPVERMIEMLTTSFDPDTEVRGESLAICSGRGGSCLSHSHKDHFFFVLQTLVLWREIMFNMFELWRATESDLLGNGGHYRLCNTGQGLNRVQSAPNVSAIMSRILGKVKAEVRAPSKDNGWLPRSWFGRGWVGLSVVHLGDRDVPNALVFIDKYMQVPRILAPIVRTLEQIEGIGKTNAKLRDFIIREYESTENCARVVLRDFVRHGFDGSGDDGGSCIDGRLTSAWNWCSKISKKKFYPIFLLTDFVGFDGDFRK